MKRYTLRYRTVSNQPLVLYNLSLEGANQIEWAQRGLGSHGFTMDEQPHHFSQQEIDLMKHAEGDER